MVKLVNIMLYVMNMPDFLSIFHPLHPPSLRWFRCATLFWDGVFDPLRNVMIGFPLIAVCPYAPWCWYIYLQNWVILFGQMLVNIPYIEHMGWDSKFLAMVLLLVVVCGSENLGYQ